MKKMMAVLVPNDFLKKLVDCFLETDLDVFCPNKAERCCDDGRCKGVMTLKDGVYYLTTGIIMGADYFGSSTFTLDDVKIIESIKPISIIVAHHHNGGHTSRVRLRIKRKHNKKK